MVKNLANKLIDGTKNKARRFVSTLGLSALLLYNVYFSNNCSSPSSPVIPDSNPTATLSVSPESGISPAEFEIELDGFPREYIEKYVLTISDSDNSSGLSSYRTNEPGINRLKSEATKEFQKREVQRSSKIREKRRGQRNRSFDAQSRGIEKLEAREQTKIYQDLDAGVPRIGFEMSPALENVQPYKKIIQGSFDSINEVMESSSPIKITRIYDVTKDTEIYFIGKVFDINGRESAPVSKSVIVSPREDIYISGILSSNESDSPVHGILKVFDPNKNLLETILTNASGQFNFRIKNRASELEDLTIQAALRTPGNLESWIRTINIPALSQSNVSIVAVPYGEFKSNPNEFRNFMYEVTHDGNPRMFDYENFNKGFIIIKENLPDSIDNGKPEGKGKFTPEQVQYIKKIITPGIENVEKILNTSNYTIKIYANANSKNCEPGAGVIRIIPSTAPAGNPDYGGLFVPYSIENLMQGADIYIKDSLTPAEWGLKGAILHEIGHTIYGPTTNPNSRMYYSGPTYYTSLDLKGMNIIYEPSFRTSGWRINGHPVESLKYILGKNFEK